MAIGNVIVTVVDVGQGQCTFVEIWDDDGMNPELLYTLLFDCGSDKTSDETSTNLDYIADRVSQMSTPTFDCVFFSHSDKDHISLMYDLLQKFSTQPAVSQVWYGGDWDQYTKSGFNILDYLVSNGYCAKKNIYTTGSDYTGYDKSQKKFTHYLWQSSGGKVEVFPVASNVLSDDPDWDDQDQSVWGKTAEAKNRVSIVCALYYAGSSYVICGDATNKTMAAINTLFDSTTTVFNSNLMTTLPHHGSRATGFAVKSSEVASAASVKVVKTFAKNMKSQTLTASAYAKHRHPSLQLMNSFIPTLDDPILKDPRLEEGNAHRITANVDIALGTGAGFTIYQGNDYSFEAQTNTFSTYYFDGSDTFSYNLGMTTVNPSEGLADPNDVINSFACWQYETQTDGDFLLGGYANLSLPLDLFTDAADDSSLAAKARRRPAKKTAAETPALPQTTGAVSFTIKPRVTRKPAQPAMQFQSRLKHFH